MEIKLRPDEFKWGEDQESQPGREFIELKQNHPELSEWTVREVMNAWGDYSEDIHCAGWIVTAKGRDNYFIAYLVGKQRGIKFSYGEPFDLLNNIRKELFE